MISHVDTWKAELKREIEAAKERVATAHRLKKTLAREEARASIEKFAFISAYYIRKLGEANHLSDELESTPIGVIAYTSFQGASPIERFAVVGLSDFYNFRKPQCVRLSLDKFCNLLIHSFLFAAKFYKERVRVFFNSDNTKDTTLYEVEFNTLVEIAERVVDDEIVVYIQEYLDGGKKRVRKSRKPMSREEFDKFTGSRFSKK